MGLIKTMASEQEIQKNNLQAEIAMMKAELDNHAKIMSDALSESARLADDRVNIAAERKSLAEAIATHNKEIEDKTTDIELAKIDAENKVEEACKIVAKASAELKDITRQLSWMNEKLISAHQEEEQMIARKLKLEEETRELLSIVANKESEQAKLYEAKSSHQSILDSISKREEEVQIIVNQAQAEVFRLNAEAEEARQKAEHAQFECKKYTDQLYSAVNDWQIIRARIEVPFKQLYPELELPLMA